MNNDVSQIIFYRTFFVVTIFYTFAVQLSYGVMVAQQILVLFVQVRVLVRQQKLPGNQYFLKDTNKCRIDKSSVRHFL